MNLSTRPSNSRTHLALLTFAGLFLLTGCLPLDGGQAASDSGHTPAAAAAPSTTAATAEPYSPADIHDLLVPGELEWQRDKSVSINTASFTGGILNFTGRVEVNSLTDFFVNAMKKEGWSSIGSVRSENVLLAFVKEKASCLIKIDEGGTLGKTGVSISITHQNN